MLALADRPLSMPADDPRPHAVIVGAGFGGLAAGIRLGARGYRTTVLERLPAPGGRASVFTEQNFTFDMGPTVITAPFLFEELWTLAGRRMADDIDLRAVDPFYRIRFDDGTIFNYSGDPDTMRAEVRRLSPGDVAGYESFMRASADIYRVGFERLGDVPFSRPADMARILPELVRLGAWRSVHGLVSTFVHDEKLRTLLSFHPLLIGGNPFAASAIYALIAHLERAHGVHYCMGGTGALVRGLVRLLKHLGGTLRTGADVASITTERGRATGVRLVSGERVEADIVVSNADSGATYTELLRGEARRRWTDAKLARARYSMGLFVWYFGTRRAYPEVAHHTILLGPRYRGLLDDIFSRHVLGEDFSLYLHRPTATDPAMAPPGADAFYVLSPVPNGRAGIDWGREAEPYRRQIEEKLRTTLLPDLDRTVAVSRVMTPADFESRYRSPLGAAFGLEPILSQSAWFRPHNKSEEIENLFLVGAGTHPGAGLPGVLSSARVLDRLVPAHV